MASLRAVVASARDIFGSGAVGGGGADALRQRLGALAVLMDELVPADFNLETASSDADRVRGPSLLLPFCSN